MLEKTRAVTASWLQKGQSCQQKGDWATSLGRRFVPARMLRDGSDVSRSRTSSACLRGGTLLADRSARRRGTLPAFTGSLGHRGCSAACASIVLPGDGDQGLHLRRLKKRLDVQQNRALVCSQATTALGWV